MYLDFENKQDDEELVCLARKQRCTFMFLPPWKCVHTPVVSVIVESPTKCDHKTPSPFGKLSNESFFHWLWPCLNCRPWRQHSFYCSFHSLLMVLKIAQPHFKASSLRAFAVVFVKEQISGAQTVNRLSFDSNCSQESCGLIAVIRMRLSYDFIWEMLLWGQILGLWPFGIVPFLANPTINWWKAWIWQTSFSSP